MERKSSYYKIALCLLVAMHIAGFIGLQHPLSRPLFEELIAFNLFTTAAIMLFFHGHWSRMFVTFCIVTFLGGYLVEVAGVHTGAIFGEYTYGKALGIKLWEVPLLIGLNWLVLVYCTGIITGKLPVHITIKILLSALLMVVLDFFIEPVAISYDWWTWKENTVPLQNYIGWFVSALVLLTLFHLLPFGKQNKIAPVIYGIQLLFFIAQYNF